jgi:predicted dehydrogenase
MSASYTAAVIGTGPDPENPSAEGYAMGYQHADALAADDRIELVTCADIVPENAEAFADAYDLDGDRVFEDYEEMLAALEPDLATVAVPPAIHAAVIMGCLESGVVEAIHCEKPMADTWGDAQFVAQEAWRRDVQLTFNHQRRFGKPFRKAKALLDRGEIGDLERVEFAAGNVYDYGTHSIDLCNYFNDETPAEWVIGQVDYREENVFFGAHNENQAFALWGYENGVHGMADTGDEVGGGAVACHNRFVGSEGVIEVGPGWAGGDEDLPTLRYRSDGEGWEAVDVDGETLHGPDFIERAFADVIDHLESGAEPELSARNALNATEIVFGIWESARRRARVDFPLEIEDNPLAAMVESGALSPEPADDE